MMNLKIILNQIEIDQGISGANYDTERRIFFGHLNEESQTSNTNNNEDSWKYLPTCVIVKIYEFLEDYDRYNFALVCKAWNALFSYPTLWREREFRFGGLRASRLDSSKAINFLKKQGGHLHRLIITCDHPTQSVAKAFQKTVKSMTGILLWKHTQLRELYVPRLHLDRFWRMHSLSDRLTSSLCRFLRRQELLHTFDMSYAGMPIKNGFQVLQVLAKTSLGEAASETPASSRCRNHNVRIKELNLEDFFQPRISVYRETRFLKALQSFKRLSSLSVNYHYISDEVLQVLMDTCGRNFNYMNIKVLRNDPNFHRIERQTWKRFKRTSPNLQVCIYFEGIGKFSTISRVLQPDIPLVSLQIWTGLHHQDENWNLDGLLRHVGDQFTTLEDLSLGLETGPESIDSALLYMLQRLPRLEELDLHTSVETPDTIETICVMRLENKLGFTKCNVTLENLTGLDIEAIEEIQASYEEELNQKGCDFHIDWNEIILF